jgi:3-methyladenine DNA glycosylase AlkC
MVMVISPEQLIEQVRGKSLRSMRHLCFETSRDLKPEDAFALAKQLLFNPDIHGAMAATLLAGHVSYILPEALAFLREKCSLNTDVRVQDCLARGFDHFCLNRGYDRAMPVMQDWGKDANEIVRRAAVEAPRPWSRKDYFAARPELAIEFLTKFKNDSSGNVRFSAGRALAEVAEDFPDLVMKELKSWNLHHPPVKHTYMFAAKNLHAKMGVLYTE